MLNPILIDTIKLYAMINECFDNAEIRELCFRLDLDYEDLSGDTKKVKIQELIAKCRRTSQLVALIECCEEKRPNFDWQAIINQDTILEKVHIDPNLPARRTPFVNRDEEKKRIINAINDGWNVISIEGLGGFGKTSLALEVIHDLRENKIDLNEPIDAYVYITARNNFLDINYFFNRIARTLNLVHLEQADMDEKSQKIRQLLREQRILILADNMETLNDRELIDYLLDDVSQNSLVLITTRDREISGRPLRKKWTVRVGELPEHEAITMTRLLIESFDLGNIAHINDNDLVSLIRVISANPQALRTALGYLEDGELTSNSLVIELTKSGEIHEELYTLSWNTLEQNARNLLMLMAFFDESASRETLQGILNVEDSVFRKSLAQLVRKSLLNQAAVNQKIFHHFSLHSLTLTFVRAKTKQFPEWEEETREKWINWFLNFALDNMEHDWSHETYLSHANLNDKWTNLMSVFNWCREHNIWDDRIELFWLNESVSEFTKTYGYWDERLYWLNWLKMVASERNDHEGIVDATSGIIWTLARQGSNNQYQEALDQAMQAWNLREFVTSKSLCNLSDNIAVLYTKLEDQDEEALIWFEQALSLLEEAEVDDAFYARKKCHIIYYKAEYYQMVEKDFNKAGSLYKEGYKYAKQGKWHRAVYFFKNRLADIAIMQGNISEAKNLLENGVEMARSRKDRRAIALYNSTYARLEKKQNNHSQSAQYAQDALKEFNNLGMQREAKQMKQLLTEIK